MGSIAFSMKNPSSFHPTSSAYRIPVYQSTQTFSPTAPDAPERTLTCIVVGNGPVGFAFLEKLKKYDTAQQYKLIVFGEENQIAYDRVRLTTAFQMSDYQALAFSSRSWYDEQQIELNSGETVITINADLKQITTSQGRTLSYDLLVLATGSRPFVPPIDGNDKSGIYVYRTIEDVDRIKSGMQQAKSAAVLGGGLLGLEAAKALHDAGLETHVVEMATVLMARQLDTLGAELLKQKILQLGVKVHLLRRTQKIESHNSQKRLTFDDETTLDVDLVVISTGIRPRDELGREAGLTVGPRGGIVVNSLLRTSDPHIYAIGECALIHDRIYGLAAPGYQMADTLARTLCGMETRFEGSDESTRLKLMGVEVSLIGDYLNEESATSFAYSSPDHYRKILLQDNQLVGVVGVGTFQELSRMQEGINKRRYISPTQRRRFQKTGLLWPEQQQIDVASWPADAIVCNCRHICRGQLSEAVLNGCLTIEQLAEATGASTVCGSCRPLLASMVSAPTQIYTHLPGNRILLVVSVLVLILIVGMSWVEPVSFAQSVLDPQYPWQQLWRVTAYRQLTGFILLGVTVAALALSLRKRWKSLAFLNYGYWRAGHSIIGMVTVIGTMIHTGLHLGQHLNLYLMLTFLSLNFVGALTGLVTAIETRTTGVSQRWIQNSRPVLTWMHILLFWPFPILVTFHILASFWL
jgi:nitrite reductase (NADH) large subunit